MKHAVQSRVLYFFIVCPLVLALTGCYRKLYFQTVNEKVAIVNDNQKLGLENGALKSDNTTLNKQVQTLTKENQALAAQITDVKNKTRKFDLFFRQFCCDKTTEKGADEVYITILGTKIGSGEALTRVPSDPKAHWDMNDGHQHNDNPSGDSHCMTNRALVSGAELKPGETYYYNVTVFEQDGGNSATYQTLVAGILAKTGDPFSVAAGTFIGALTKLGFFVSDSDDWMGMFGVKVTNNDGVLTTEWEAKEGIVHIHQDLDYRADPNRKEIRMNHDGSNYVGWFGIRY